MRILIAFVVAFGIGAGSRWTGVPSLAPQAIVGALLIVAMSTGWVTADRIMSHKPAASVSSSEKPGNTTHTRGARVISEQLTTTGAETDTAFWKDQSEGLRLIIADLLRANEELREAIAVKQAKSKGRQSSDRPMLQSRM